MIETSLMKILVTVWLAGHAPIQELLPADYPVTDNAAKCREAADGLLSHAVTAKGVKVEVRCVPGKTRGA